MNKFCLLLFFACLISLVPLSSSGYTPQDNEVSFSEFPTEASISFEKLYSFERGIPFRIYALDSNLIILNEQGNEDFFFYNYSLETNELSEGYVKGGRGPGEMMRSISSGVIGDTFWAFDDALQKMITVNKNKVISYENKADLVFNEYRVRQRYYTVSLVDNQSFVAVGSFYSGLKVQEVDLKSGKETNEFGEFNNVPSEMTANAYKMGHQAFVFTKPTGGKVTSVYRFTDMIDIHDLETKETTSIKGPKGFDVQFNSLNVGDFYVMERTKKTRFAFVSGAVTDSYIYALYSGRLDFTELPHYATSLYVYDWEGNPVKKIDLGREITTIAVSPDDKTLYAYDPNTGYIVRGNLD